MSSTLTLDAPRLPTLLTLAETADALRCCEASILRNQGRDTMPRAFKVGGRWLVRRDDVARLLGGE